MPHFAHTPEALLGRNDSKNPATTCKGITSAGRPCRRALAASKTSLRGRRSSTSAALGGVVATVEEDGEIQEADFYCWQHKDQATQAGQNVPPEGAAGAARNSKRRTTELYSLKEKSSIDTMVQRLGIDAADEGAKSSWKHTRNPKPPRKTHTTDFAAEQRPMSQAPYAEKYNLGRVNQPRPQRRKPGFWASLCCMTNADDDYVEIVRHKTRVEQPQMTQPTGPSCAYGQRPVRPAPASAAVSARQPNAHGRPSSTTTSALLAELTKPIGANDEEGYIYIFWLTPQSKGAPTESTARSLLSPPELSRRPGNQRRISDVMTEYSFDGDEPDSLSSKVIGSDGRQNKRTIMLKIGRASNITRRMNEWQRQCGYALNLVRWYPYVSSSPQLSPQQERRPLYPDLSRPPPSRRQSSGEAVRKVPCVKRVERLIHLELAERQVKRQCTACGKEHREWFEVEASQAGVKGVDEVVRRWVGWGERQAT
ncbi:uncharacterized protein LTR77_007030 [Saxophila tyrrhenica]|uniref:Bacteriophage T5 Orf172 DNA-binding domain-containing protein n=1 Tax=Saxophila tyrrhenica TaxID=1690608 RepID=A0AAV9P5H6_9PEZI|nr:hypothetical protein LTR77_007030 [Saxophila tyrrhenica]